MRKTVHYGETGGLKGEVCRQGVGGCQPGEEPKVPRFMTLTFKVGIGTPTKLYLTTNSHYD
jgi:hypothetical protein